MSTSKLIFLILSFIPLSRVTAQTNSSSALSQKLSPKYFNQTSEKINRYTKRVTDKTERTLVKLCRWESKIQALLLKANPEAVNSLFNNSSLSFKKLLEEYKNADSKLQQYQAEYDKYRDELVTQLKYIDSNRNLISEQTEKVLKTVKNKVNELEQSEAKNVAFQKMIKERRQLLINESIKYLGKNKYLQKINKEGWYYTETLRNYKQLFNEPGKAEEIAKNILSKIPAFKKFMHNNSMLASLFRVSEENSSSGGSQLTALAGVQTRASVNSLIQSQIATGGPNAMAQVRQNLQAAQAEMNKLKDKLIKAGDGTSDTEMPDFKPNTQKTKTFFQRIEYGFNMQFGKRTNWMPGSTDIALTIGYKLNDKSFIGIGTSYKLGMGSIERIRFSHEGIGLRSYIDWKIKKQFFVSGGYELNHFTSFKSLQNLQDSDAWRKSALIGISKKIPLKTKFSKGSKIQLMHDLLYRHQLPVGQPWIFRIGYDLK